MHPADCPKFDYSVHPRRQEVLVREVATIVAAFRRGQIDTSAAAEDTRPVHRRLFRELTAQGYEYFAGHYRGEDFRCLEYYEVKVLGDPRVGLPAATVGVNMEDLGNRIRAA